MSHSPTHSNDDADLRPDYENQDAADELQEQFLAEERDQREELSEAEKTKRRLLEAKRSQTVSIDVEAGGVTETIEFRTLDGDAKDFIEEIGIRFGTETEEEALKAMKESGDEYLDKRDDLAGMLESHAVDDAYGEEFFETLYSGGERLSIIGDIAEAESSAGN